MHFHPGFDLTAFFHAASSNIRSAAGHLGFESDTVGCLLLAESGTSHTFHDLQSGRANLAAEWSVHSTGEDDSLVVRHAGRVRLLIVAGRQIATSEGLEVLALLTRERFGAGLQLQAAIEAAHAAGAVPVIPWGFGKWTLHRGSVVAAAVRGGAGRLFLGDNGGRFGHEPPLFVVARRAGIPVLPGSDPLPFARHQRRVGSFGFVADVAVDLQKPSQQLRQWLSHLKVQPGAYGTRVGFGAFVRDQVGMQLLKHGRRLRP